MLRRVSASLLLIIAVLAAFWLAMRRADIPYGELEVLYGSVDSEFITLKDGLVVHYTDQGPADAPVILLLHGFASSSLTWADWQNDLKSEYRVISADLPGHGLTRNRENQYLSSEGLAQYVADLVQALALDRFVIAGSSMGGHAAWLYASDHQDRLKGLVLVAGAGLPTLAEESAEPFVFRLLAIPLIRPMLADIDPTPLVRAGLQSAFVDTKLVTDKMIRAYSDLARAPGHRRALMILAGRSRTNAGANAARLNELDLPVLILHGEEDRVIPVEHATRFDALIPGAEVVTYPDTGHLPHEELVTETLDDLRGFLLKIYSEPETAAEETSEPVAYMQMTAETSGSEN